ncbi:MAG: 30S ribosomal protein S12 methylthiotransferase RimO [Lachnospiraceae bacterium]|nr:30S ribosomal protein S12 methylthiotransferase RimO [Lachnospiraceae bacterium]
MNIFFASLGCDKNLVDSEKMLKLIDEAGYKIIDDESNADVIIVNTCAFINDALEESINSIIEYGSYKEIGHLKALIVTGCLAQRYKDEIFNELPEVDAVIGTNSYPHIIEIIDDILNGNEKLSVYENLDKTVNLSKRLLSTGGFYAYLKIAEGCSKRCTYCIIPTLRGNYRSFPIEEIIEEAKELVASGVKELILVAQETTVYGVDLYGEKKLPKLLDELQKIDNLQWIRLLYCYPEEIDIELINAIKRNNKVCHYIDIPIQHSSDNILKNMGRKTDYNSLNNIIHMLRDNIPDICIRTTLITGFPGENEQDFDILTQFVKDNNFERLGVFEYSRQEGTKAYDMDNQIDDAIKIERKNKIMELQQNISKNNNQKLIGSVLEVFIEGKLTDSATYVGRTYRDAPGVDGYIFIESDTELNSGDFCKCVVTAFNEYDLIGVKQ